MTYYVKIVNGTIQIIPRWRNKLSKEFVTDQEYLNLATISTLNNNILIPLNKFNSSKVPAKVTIYYGKEEFSSLDSLVDSIYKSRSYSISEEAAKNRIQKLLLKGMAQKSKVYGKGIDYKFDFIDASNYQIEY